LPLLAQSRVSWACVKAVCGALGTGSGFCQVMSLLIRPPAPPPQWRRSGPSGRCQFVQCRGESRHPKSGAARTRVAMTPALMADGGRPLRRRTATRGRVAQEHQHREEAQDHAYLPFTFANPSLSEKTSSSRSPSVDTPTRKPSGQEFVPWTDVVRDILGQRS